VEKKNVGLKKCSMVNHPSPKEELGKIPENTGLLALRKLRKREKS
jgi:hypothetical protein